MSTPRVILITDDLALAMSVTETFGNDGAVSARSHAQAQSLLKAQSVDGACVVVDARDAYASGVEWFDCLVRLCRSSSDTRGVLIVPPPTGPARGVVDTPAAHFKRTEHARISAGEWPVLVLRPDEAHTVLIRSHVEDPSHTVAAAAAHRACLEVLPDALHALITVAFAIGPTRVTVKSLGDHWREHRSTLARHQKDAGLPKPRFIRDLVRAAYGCAMIIVTDWSFADIALRPGLGDDESFRALVKRVFDITPSEIRRDTSSHALPALVRAWAARHYPAFAPSLDQPSAEP